MSEAEHVEPVKANETAACAVHASDREPGFGVDLAKFGGASARAGEKHEGFHLAGDAQPKPLVPVTAGAVRPRTALFHGFEEFLPSNDVHGESVP